MFSSTRSPSRKSSPVPPASESFPKLPTTTWSPFSPLTWSFPVASYAGFGVVVADGWVYGAVDGHIVRIKLSNGSRSWTAPA